jgi:hypothetical protein
MGGGLNLGNIGNFASGFGGFMDQLDSMTPEKYGLQGTGWKDLVSVGGSGSGPSLSSVLTGAVGSISGKTGGFSGKGGNIFSGSSNLNSMLGSLSGALAGKVGGVTGAGNLTSLLGSVAGKAGNGGLSSILSNAAKGNVDLNSLINMKTKSADTSINDAVYADGLRIKSALGMISQINKTNTANLNIAVNNKALAPVGALYNISNTMLNSEIMSSAVDMLKKSNVSLYEKGQSDYKSGKIGYDEFQRLEKNYNTTKNMDTQQLKTTRDAAFNEISKVLKIFG